MRKISQVLHRTEVELLVMTPRVHRFSETCNKTDYERTKDASSFIRSNDHGEKLTASYTNASRSIR